eukprot:617842-Pleurochrysis_carterae.AAC.1
MDINKKVLLCYEGWNTPLLAVRNLFGPYVALAKGSIHRAFLTQCAALLRTERPGGVSRTLPSTDIHGSPASVGGAVAFTGRVAQDL